MDTKQGKLRGGGGVMNWAIGIDMYTLMYLKLMTNKDLLYKKIKKLKIKEEQEEVFLLFGHCIRWMYLLSTI